jgi:hypothetical protein
LSLEVIAEAVQGFAVSSLPGVRRFDG